MYDVFPYVYHKDVNILCIECLGMSLDIFSSFFVENVHDSKGWMFRRLIDHSDVVKARSSFHVLRKVD